MGQLGEVGAQAVREAMQNYVDGVRRGGRAAGVLAPDEAYAREYLARPCYLRCSRHRCRSAGRAARKLLMIYRGIPGGDRKADKHGSCLPVDGRPTDMRENELDGVRRHATTVERPTRACGVTHQRN